MELLRVIFDFGAAEVVIGKHGIHVTSPNPWETNVPFDFGQLGFRYSDFISAGAFVRAESVARMAYRKWGRI